MQYRPTYTSNQTNLSGFQDFQMGSVFSLGSIIFGASRILQPSSAHSLVPLRKLATVVKEIYLQLREMAEERYEEFSETLKSVTTRANQWDTDTQNVVRMLHSARDSQVRLTLYICISGLYNINMIIDIGGEV